MKKCLKCGFENESDNNFCLECGSAEFDFIGNTDDKGLSIGKNSSVSAHDMVGGNKETIHGKKEVISGNKEEINAQNYTVNQTVIHQQATTNNQYDAEMMEIEKKKRLLEAKKLEAEIAKLQNESNTYNNEHKQQVDADKIARLEKALADNASALLETQNQIKQAQKHSPRTDENREAKAYAPIYAPTPQTVKKSKTKKYILMGVGVIVVVAMLFVFIGGGDKTQQGTSGNASSVNKSSSEFFADGLSAYKKSNYEQAAIDFLKAAKLGNLESYYHLGMMYLEGKGVDKNSNTAFLSIQKAANKDHKDATYQLGLMYEGGIGIDKDMDKARTWYKKAVGLGHSKAKKRLENL